MKIWVTGESGFLARSLSRCLPPTHEVVNRLGSDYYDYFRSYSSGMKGYIKEIDIFDPTLPVLISRSEAECIVHTAAMVGDRRCDEFPAAALRTNIEGTFHVVNAANEVGIPIIYIGLFAPIGNRSIYSISKFAAEQLVNISAKNFISLSCPDLYGIGDFNGPIGQLFETIAMKKETAIIDMEPDTQKAFIYVDDLCEAISSVIDKLEEVNKNGFVLKPDKPHTLTEIIDKFDKMDLTMTYEIHPEKDTFGATIDKANADFFNDIYHWKAKTTLGEGLKAIRKSYGK
jgi:nucleoside-diphosphate-sugar epimerase